MATRPTSPAPVQPAPPMAPRATASADPNPLEGLPEHSPLAGWRQHAGPVPRLASLAPTGLLRAIHGAQPTGQALSRPMVPADQVAPPLSRTRIGPDDTP